MSPASPLTEDQSRKPRIQIGSKTNLQSSSLLSVIHPARIKNYCEISETAKRRVYEADEEPSPHNSRASWSHKRYQVGSEWFSTELVVYMPQHLSVTTQASIPFITTTEL